MNHTFNTEIADMYGVNEAILIENIYFWVSKNKANGKHYHDGKYWTYNSTKAFSELFYYWSESQIERIIKSLVDKNVIEIGNYNEMKFDRTRWISLNESVCSIYRNRKMDLTESPKGFNEIATTIPDINTNINTDTVDSTAIAVVDKASEFNKFWQLYPRKQSKASALKSWNKVKPLEYDKIFESLPVFIKSEQWTKSNGEFIPYPATWLNQQRWNDEVSKSSKPCISEGKKIDGGWQL